jgi:hypothetical protein
MLLTVADVFGWNDFEFPLNVRVEQPVEIESVGTFLPTGKITDFIPVDYIAFPAKVIDVGDLRIDGSQKKSRVCDCTIADIRRPVIPSESNAIVIIVLLVSAFGTAFGLQELHNTSNRVWSGIADCPGRRIINMVFEGDELIFSERTRSIIPLTLTSSPFIKVTDMLYGVVETKTRKLSRVNCVSNCRRRGQGWCVDERFM